MSDLTSEDRAALVEERRQALDAKSKGRIGRVFGIVFFVLVFGLVGALVIAPERIRSFLLEAGTSTSQTMQSALRDDSGISTDMTVREPVEVEPLDVDTPMPDPPPSPVVIEPSATDAELAALRERVAELQELGAEQIAEIRSLLDAQSRTLREQFEAERDAREAQFQRELQAARSAVDDRAADEEAARSRLEAERERRRAIAEAQIASDAIILDGAGTAAGEASTSRGDRELTSNEEFIAAASSQGYETVRATVIADPGRTIVQGSAIQAVLETAVSTELPGIIRAVTTRDVYSYDGDNVLLPRGTRLIGSYNSDVSIAQNRVQIAWNRAVTPDGISVELGGYGADQLGMSGQSGKVDSRFRQRFGTAALITLITLTPRFIVSEESDANTRTAVEDFSGTTEDATNSALEDYLSLEPVIYIFPGTTVSVLVNRDLVF